MRRTGVAKGCVSSAVVAVGLRTAERTTVGLGLWLWGTFLTCLARWNRAPLVVFVVLSYLCGVVAAAGQDKLPNILWITCEDISPNLGCYGDSYAQTPNLDRLAGKGMIYRHAWSNAPVCAPARTTIISGVYPTSTGAEHMRSEVRMPSFMKMFPQLLRERGYYCTNNSKEDYNLVKPGRVWDESSGRAHWKNRKPGQPFFAVFNSVVSHESRIRTRPHVWKHDPAKARVPAYHPDTPEVRKDWAQYYDQITVMDSELGERLAEVEAAGLMDETIVFFYGDHGSGMPRSKRFLYNSGLQVPLIVYVPPKYRHLAPKDYAPGAKSDRLVAFIDLAPTLLSLAGIQPPEWMQGHAFMGKHEAPPQRYMFGFRGRMDERYDIMRSVCNGRYVYIRNYMPQLPCGQHVSYMFETPTTRVWKKLFDEGKLTPEQAHFWQPKPAEELYDLENDRDEVHNLATSPAHQTILQELRQAHKNHVLAIRDTGFLTEAEAHRRAKGTTIYEMGHDRAKYDLETIFAMADLATSRRPEVLPQLKEALKSSDSGVRYWGASGMQILGADAVHASGGELRQTLSDSSPSVRIAAAWALGQYGKPDDLSVALTTLEKLAPPDKTSAYVSVFALNVIDALGVKAAPLADKLKNMPVKDPKAPERANGYVNRLIKDLPL